jgi:WD40 repeat protein
VSAATIDSLLSLWEERRSGGDAVTAEDLCRDHPELLETLSRAIERRRAEIDLQSTGLPSGDRFAPLAETIEWSGGGPIERFGPAQGPGEIARLGPFGIVRLLGAGGMGAVFEAVEAPLGRRVALKVMTPRLASVETARARFLREARAAAALENDHIVPIYRVGEDNGISYLTMPLLHGETLDSRLKTGPRLSNAEVLRIGREIAEGLAVAHARSMVHRDVKPANIWIEEGHGRVKILDFGLARMADAEANLTQEGAVLGTPAYMSPEQASGGGEVGHLSDLFSLGSVLYRMVTSRPPFVADSEAELLMALMKVDPVPPRQLNPDTPAGLDALILRLLAKEPEARPVSAAAVAEEIRALEQPGTASAPVLEIDTGEEAPKSLAQRPTVPLASRRWLWWWIATASLALLVAAGAGLAVLFRPRQAVFNEETLVGEPRVSRVERTPAVAAPSSPPPTLRVTWPTPPLDDKTLPGFVPHPMPAPPLGHWQIETRQPHGRVAALVWSPDGRRLACAASDRVVRIYGSLRLDLVGLLAGHAAPVMAVSWSPNGARLASGGGDGTVRLWDADGRPRLTLKGHSEAITATAWNRDGTHFASSSKDRTVRVWTISGAPGPVLSGHAAGINAVAWSPDGMRIATAGDDGTLRLWDADGTPGPVFNGHAGSIFGVAWSPDGTRIATAGDDRTVRIWDARGTPGPILEGHAAAVRCVAWSPDGATIASGSADTTIRLWSSAGTPASSLELHEEVGSLAWSPNGRQLAAGGVRGTLRRWVTKGTGGMTLPGGAQQVSCLAVSPDGTRISLGRWPQARLRIWGMDLIFGPILKGHTAGVRGLAWSPDGATLASASTDKSVRLWAANGTPGPVLEGHAGLVNAVAWSGDGKRLASASTDQSVRLWIADGTPGPVLEGHAATVLAVAWDPKGDRLASASADGTVRLWAGDGTPRAVLTRSDSAVLCVAWSPDGSRLAWGNSAGDVRLCKADGTLGPVLKGHTGAVSAIAWHPDGDRLATAGDDTVRLWDAEGRAGPVLTVREGAEAIGVAWSADAQTLTAASGDGFLRVWDVRTLATRWIAFQPGALAVVRFASRGRNTLFTPAAFNALTYLVEQPDGSVTLMTHEEFHKAAGW